MLAVERTRKYYYSFQQTDDAYAIYLSSQVIVGLLKVWLSIFALIILLFYKRQFYNLIFYKRKKFIEDDRTVDFIKQFCPNFQNAYSINYVRDDDLLEQEEARVELPASEYQHLVSQEIIIEKASYLFDRYQQDLRSRNLKSIKEYSLEPFRAKHKYISDRNINNRINIRYNYKLSEIIPLNFEVREELNRFLVQINGEIISFQVSDEGYVLSGEPQLRYFTQYWDIALGAENIGYIIAICNPED